MLFKLRKALFSRIFILHPSLFTIPVEGFLHPLLKIVFGCKTKIPHKGFRFTAPVGTAQYIVFVTVQRRAPPPNGCKGFAANGDGLYKGKRDRKPDGFPAQCPLGNGR